MYVKKDPKDYFDCPIRLAIDILSTSWNAWLIQEINNGVKRPSDLYRTIHVAPKRVLAKQLAELEKRKILDKKIYPVLPLKVEYYLTDMGKELLPILNQLELWGEKYKNQFIENNSQ